MSDKLFVTTKLPSDTVLHFNHGRGVQLPSNTGGDFRRSQRRHVRRSLLSGVTLLPSRRDARHAAVLSRLCDTASLHSAGGDASLGTPHGRRGTEVFTAQPCNSAVTQLPARQLSTFRLEASTSTACGLHGEFMISPRGRPEAGA